MTYDMFTQAYWDDRYSGHRHVWSGRPNPNLVSETEGLTPRRAIDVGCGEGADAIWLARRGWEVTGADVSPVGLERAARNAEGAGAEIAGRITWRQVDLFAEEWTPPPGKSSLQPRPSAPSPDPRARRSPSATR